MTQKSEIGKLGEDLACEYLVKQSFTVIERNFRKPWGEIDIIAKDPKGVLVFVEVKTMRQYGNSAIQPEENLTAAKLKKLQRTASLYVGHHQELINDKKGWRIDLVAIALTDETASINPHTKRALDATHPEGNARYGVGIKYFENI